MEKLFHRRWWDYSQKAFNLNGRVCLEGFICFGLFSVVAIDYVQPFFTSKLLLVDENILFVLSGVLSVLFIVDTIVSTIKRTDKTPLKTNKIFSSTNNSLLVKKG